MDIFFSFNMCFLDKPQIIIDAQQNISLFSFQPFIFQEASFKLYDVLCLSLKLYDLLAVHVRLPQPKLYVRPLLKPSIFSVIIECLYKYLGI